MRFPRGSGSVPSIPASQHSSIPASHQLPCFPPAAEEKKKLAEEKAIEIEEQNKIIAVEKAEAETALAEVMPILEAAKLELQKLDKSDVTEIRYRLPPLLLHGEPRFQNRRTVISHHAGAVN